MTAWVRALEAIEREVTTAERALAESVVPEAGDDAGLVAGPAAGTEPTGITAATGFTPPTDLGPLPAGLAPRARSLVARAEEVQTALHDRMAELDRQRAQLGVRRQALTAYVTADRPGIDVANG